MYKPCAADEYRQVAARPHGGDCGVRVGLIVGEGVALVWPDHVQQVVWEDGALVGRRLGRRDIHEPIDLSRIGGDDLSDYRVAQRSASAMASAVLPLAVGPTMASNGILVAGAPLFT